MKHYKNNKRKGFTLIELLVVIAIIAVLSIVVILTLNPAEILKRARDSNRISDLNTMKSATSLYLADVASPNLWNSVVAGVAGSACSITVATTTCPGSVYINIAAAGTSTPTAANLRSVTGNGWIPVAYTTISSGAPIGAEPLDPSQSGNLAYSYKATSSPGTSFKMAAKTESVYYSASGTQDVVSTDGGNDNNWYETGTELKM